MKVYTHYKKFKYTYQNTKAHDKIKKNHVLETILLLKTTSFDICPLCNHINAHISNEKFGSLAQNLIAK